MLSIDTELGEVEITSPAKSIVISGVNIKSWR